LADAVDEESVDQGCSAGGGQGAAHDVGVYGAGGDGVDGDAIKPQFSGQGSG
jgi:hypothetical protein